RKTCQKRLKCMEYLAKNFNIFGSYVQFLWKTHRKFVYHFAQKPQTVPPPVWYNIPGTKRAVPDGENATG
ncbi:MAG: hypothetical protein ACLUIX_06065, partial [Oscillospiraceae bacterium]